MDKISWENLFQENLDFLIKEEIIKRIWSKDYGIWNLNSEFYPDRLGWLDVLDFIDEKKHYIHNIRNNICNEEFDHIILLGMGGSSLGAEVVYNIITKSENKFPNLTVIDTIIPQTIDRILKKIDLKKSFFIVSSKSGTTLEPLLLYKFFKDKVKENIGSQYGSRFMAITDEGTPLADLALNDNFRYILYNPTNIGGRYSALSFFGLIPPILCGVNFESMLIKAKSINEESKLDDLDRNSSARLGAFMAAMIKSGRDKMTLIISEEIKSLGLWIEQLVAESCGKDGVGLIPIYDEPLISPKEYSDDRFFVYIKIREDKELDSYIKQIEENQSPLIKLELEDEDSLGAEFFRWEFATALLGAFLNINPFDQPNGQLTKDITSRLLLEGIPHSYNDLPCSFLSLDQMLNVAKPNSYLAIMAYIDDNSEINETLQLLRKRITKEFGIATTLGYGPRFLHSTGQLHKGGVNSGLFLQITEKKGLDYSIPGQSYSLKKLVDSQAFGDRLALSLNARKVMHIEIDNDLSSSIDII